MRKHVSYYISSSVVRMLSSFLITLPIVTYYLSVKEIGTIAYLMLISGLIMVPINTGSGLIINAYYFTSSDKQRKELFFHLYFIELLLKIVLFFCSVLLSYKYLYLLIDDYQEYYLELFYILAASFIFTSSNKSILNNFFVVREESRQFFYFNFFEIVITIVFTIAFLYFFQLGILGYSIVFFIVPFIMFIINIYIIKKHLVIGLNKYWISIIYNKGIKLFYGNLIENFLNFYENYVIQAAIGIYQVGLYTHSKQYLASINILDKSFFQAYSVNYLMMLYGDGKLNIFKVTLFWYSLILFIGIFIVYFSGDVISQLTHDKFTESSKYLAILYIFIFFKSNLQQYSYQLIYYKRNELFIFFTSLTNGFVIVLLMIFLLQKSTNIEYILYIYVFGFIIKNFMIKIYSIRKYKLIDVSEVLFWISLAIYLIILNMEYKVLNF